MPRKPVLVGLLGLVVAMAAYLVRGGEDIRREVRGGGAGGGPESADARPGSAGALGPAVPWTDADWDIFRTKVRTALEARWDTLPMGETVAHVGRTFVGTPYVAHTLERPGPEHLVVDFRALDCVTFVETAFTTARFVHAPDAGALLERPEAAQARYDSLLTQLRYRGGVLEGYPSRLHYFTDWIGDARAKGLVEDVTRQLGGIPVTDPVTFMTRHPDAYRQIREHGANLEQVRLTEERLSGQARWFIPQDSIGGVASRIRDGDIIAATSTVPGLDVAHTGLALWVDGALHLMHAPLVGDSVQISEQPLAERILRISGQDGIMVARPLDGAGASGARR